MTNTPDYSFLIIVDSYLRLVLSSWPAVILILGLFLLIKFRAAIDYFIRNKLESIGPDGIKGGSGQQKGESMNPPSSQGIQQPEENEKEVFSLLSSFLVLNTKEGLKWFDGQTKPVTTDFFVDNFNLPFTDKIPDFAREKLVIFGILIQFKLIETKASSLFMISERGKKFLKFINPV